MGKITRILVLSLLTILVLSLFFYNIFQIGSICASNFISNTIVLNFLIIPVEQLETDVVSIILQK